MGVRGCYHLRMITPPLLCRFIQGPSACRRIRVLAVLGALLLVVGCRGGSEPRLPSIILVSLDTLRADKLGSYGNSRGLTPQLDALASESVVFRHAYSQANYTVQSHASLFSSRYPSELGAASLRFVLNEGPPLLAEILATYGYQTAAFVGGVQVSEPYGLARGFQVHEMCRQGGSLYHSIGPALKWLDERESSQPFFLFLHGYDTHDRYLKPTPVGLAYTETSYVGPATDVATVDRGIISLLDGWLFDLDSPWLEQRMSALRVWDAKARQAVARQAKRKLAASLGKDGVTYLRDVYDGAVAWADIYMGLFLRELRLRNLYDDLILVVLSDHGESLGEDGIFGHSITATDRDLHVVLMVRLPGGEPRVVEAQVALLDVLPTLLDLVDIPFPASIHGHSLVPWLEGGEGYDWPAVFSEGLFRIITARTPAHRVSFTGLGADSPYLRPVLATAAIDGPAFADSTTGDIQTRERLRGLMLKWRSTLHAAAVTRPVDPEVLQQVRDHGYWGSP